MRELPEGTVTFLFTDIEGSTQLLHQLGDSYTEVLAEHRRVLRHAIAAHGGVEVDTQGDAFFVAFAEAGRAVAAARDAQRTLAGSPVRVRMGIHTGQPTRTDEGYVGLDVHRGARICAAGHGGQVLVSQTTRSLLGPEIELGDLGEHRLKDLQQPEWLFQLVGPDLVAQFPPLRSLSNTNLPAEASSLIGRTRELAAISDLLRGEARLVTLTGSGGTGKTRLALRVAVQLIEDFKNGVFLISLAPISDPGLVLSSVAQALGVKERVGETLAENVHRHLEGKRLLLLLDNFEHLLPAANVVSQLLAFATQLKVLVTSRERLRLVGEHEYAVPPLSENDALALFDDRARAVLPTFRLEDEPETVLAICRRLDLLPLALELAAARIKLLAVNDLLARLDRRLSFLVSGARDLPGRQQTLRATVDWSYELLDEREQRAFTRLSVFTGGCTLDAAEAVCDGDDQTVSSLLDKSLLRRQGDRYFMLETIREFASERLQASGEEPEIRRRHAEYIAEFAIPLGLRARRADLSATNRLEAEHDNARAAFDWALAHEEFKVCERLVEGFCFYWLQKGHIGEGYRRAKSALDRASAPSPFFVLLTGELARYSGDLNVGVELKEQAVAAYERSGVPGYLAMALSDLADVLVERREFDRAQVVAERALRIRTELGQPWGVAHASDVLVRLELERGNFLRAAELAEDCIRIWRKERAWGDLAWESVLAATAYRRASDLSRAEACLREGLRVGLKAAEALTLVQGLEQAAALAAERGRDDLALKLYGAARARRDSTGYVFAVDDTARVVSGPRLDPDRRDALLAEGAGWPLDEAVRRALESLEMAQSV
jgi:predicted ATPase/class 3 adenylate cyclase